jgi:hypothetical protein
MTEREGGEATATEGGAARHVAAQSPEWSSGGPGLTVRDWEGGEDAGEASGGIGVDVSYAAPQAHEIVNVALHRKYSPCIVFIFWGMISIMSKTNIESNSNEYY